MICAKNHDFFEKSHFFEKFVDFWKKCRLQLPPTARRQRRLTGDGPCEACKTACIFWKSLNKILLAWGTHTDTQIDAADHDAAIFT